MYLRGTVTTLRSCLSSGVPYTSEWPHDFSLDVLQPFSDYLKQTGDPTATAAQ